MWVSIECSDVGCQPLQQERRLVLAPACHASIDRYFPEEAGLDAGIANAYTVALPALGTGIPCRPLHLGEIAWAYFRVLSLKDSEGFLPLVSRQR